MTFIPRYNVKVDDFVELDYDITVMIGTFTKGHHMKVISGSELRSYSLIDVDGNKLNEIYPSNFTKTYKTF